MAAKQLSKTTSQFSSLSTCIALLQSSAQNHHRTQGRTTHSQMVKLGHLTSPLSATSLISMYSKCTSITDALSVFRESSHLHNVFLYNSIISGLTLNHMSTEAFHLYREMRLLGVVLSPDKFTFPCVIKACPDVVELKNVHGLLFKLGLVFDSYIRSALVKCYLKFELIGDAVQVFDRMPERDDVVIWNAMISGYVRIWEINKALLIFKRMAEAGVGPNSFTITGVLSALALAGDVYNGRVVHGYAAKAGYDTCIEVLNALVDMYGKCRQLDDANVVFDNMIDKDMYSWNTAVVVHQQCGDHDGTLRLLKRMISFGFQPDLVTVGAAFPACSYLSALRHGKEIHGFMVRKGLYEAAGTYTCNAIMDMYSKCGNVREARFIFDEMKDKDVASWNIMVMGYGMHGFGNDALDLFSCMCETGLKPDRGSFVGVLAACSHAGFVSKGRNYLAGMEQKYGVTPQIEHYACVIDMLGRAGMLEEALGLISSMSIEPNQVVWRSFLAACRLHGNADLAKFAVQRVLDLEPEHCGNYVLMSNIFGEAGRFDEVAEVRHSMRKQDVKKSPGCSWIELGNVMHVFFTGDRTHPEEDCIYEKLDSLTACLREHRFMQDVMESYF